jgi:hypothetical protein
MRPCPHASTARIAPVHGGDCCASVERPAGSVNTMASTIVVCFMAIRRSLPPRPWTENQDLRTKRGHADRLCRQPLRVDVDRIDRRPAAHGVSLRDGHSVSRLRQSAGADDSRIRGFMAGWWSAATVDGRPAIGPAARRRRPPLGHSRASFEDGTVGTSGGADSTSSCAIERALSGSPKLRRLATVRCSWHSFRR